MSLLGVVCLSNLVLTVGVIRRLREHDARLPTGQPEVAVRPRPMAAEMAPFTAVTTTGEHLSSSLLPTPTVVAFFSPGCRPCEVAAPRFLRYAADLPGGREQVLVIVSGGADAPAYAEQFRPVARVVVEEPTGPVQTAFGVEGSPAFGVVDQGGVIGTATRRVADLPTAVSV
ncbi:peroxiredoxin [Micromonospora sp. MW-13]|uniref:peroxiredoxin family protein n=1 Tax=Micromonospora sp. MW-13 TaxID=2094022 RepID=UPI000FFEFBC6|nr:TlpA family protein disulfide reductase [Micromonospora sp. MW-13]